MVKAVIFDMDGVIVDSEGSMLEADIGFFKKHSLEYDINEIYEGIGRARYHYKMIHKAMRDKMPDDEYDRKYHEYFNPDNDALKRDHRALLFPNLVELLQTLRGCGLKLAVASSARMEGILEVVEACEIADYFDVLLSGRDLQESKPNPEIYLLTLKKLGVEASEAYVIEDSPNGITAAKRAGITTIARRETRFPLDQSQADYFVDDLIEVLDIINPKQ